MSSYIDQTHPLYLLGERKAHEDLDGRQPGADVAWWLECAERIQVVTQDQGARAHEHEIAGYIAVLRDHLGEQAT